jgi:regulator of replication initiation timing
MAKTARTVDLEPIDRLEEKVKVLVGMLDRMRAERARAVEESQRLTRELESLRGRLSQADETNAELTALREERDVIRGRVSEMLEQLEALEL